VTEYVSHECKPVHQDSAEETDFRIPRNHRASDEGYDDHNNEFHVALTMLPFQFNNQHTAYVLLPRKQVTHVGAGPGTRIRRL
jgi:hypothetical protein